MRLRAVLFDIGGPIDTEVERERLIDADIRSCFADAGRVIDDAAYAESCRMAVESFAPNAYQAIVWRLAREDRALAERVWPAFIARAKGRTIFQFRDGIRELLGDLAGRGVRLGIAANQPQSALAVLEAAGLAGVFHYQEVSGTTGLYKPDPRVFIQACAALAVEPAGAIMVGDRIDNDIAPARMLGMAAIRFVTGRHAKQRPRAWPELPDYEVTTIPALAAALDKLLSR